PPPPPSAALPDPRSSKPTPDSHRLRPRPPSVQTPDLPDRYELHVTFTAHDADTFVEQVDY
ncbi:MAG: hypothetical protein R3210_09480, partial [Roseovarius sp.]|nr:hypothetical protein [Roseovarius sp.]